MVVPQQSNTTDEIGLVELFRALWRQKLLIIGVTLIVAVIAAAYAFLATRYDETRTYLRPVPQSNLDRLNETGMYKLTPEEAINRVAGGCLHLFDQSGFLLGHPGAFSKHPPAWRLARADLRCLQRDGVRDASS